MGVTLKLGSWGDQRRALQLTEIDAEIDFEDAEVEDLVESLGAAGQLPEDHYWELWGDALAKRYALTPTPRFWDMISRWRSEIESMKTLRIPTGLQGGKSELAAEIVSQLSIEGHFYDLCCGSGAISIELVRRGHDPAEITMVDASPWGAFWKAIGEGSFSLKKFRRHLDDLPDDPYQVRDYLRELGRRPVRDIPYVFLILQAGVFASTPVGIVGKKWRYEGFRRADSHPLVPQPNELLARVEVLAERMRGVKGVYGKVEDIKPKNGTVYIDPPYEGLTSYRTGTLDDAAYVEKLASPTYVSEARPLSGHAAKIASRRKGSFRGDLDILVGDRSLDLVVEEDRRRRADNEARILLDFRALLAPREIRTMSTGWNLHTV